MTTKPISANIIRLTSTCTILLAFSALSGRIAIPTSLAINTIRIASVAISLPAFSPLIDRDFGFLRVERKTLAMLVLGGIVALGLGWFFLAYSFIYTPEARAVPISSTTPLFSTLSATLLLHERVTPKNAAGAVMVVTGIFLIFAF